ncbi:MAG: glucosaminidase domain-containing protein [Bacteroidales bacterium]|nr:glucosaminidase domain-containing protein [Bacteroidales bacterium]
MKGYLQGILIFLFGFISGTQFLYAQLPENKTTKEEYISMYKDIALEEMNMYGIPASITLAQGILESGHGNSRLAKKANNHFGIKCHKGWTGKTFHMDDDARNECFRKYKNPYISFKDHSIFLSTRDRYAFLFDLEITDYKGWARGLKKAGYATNPKYPQLLIKIIEDYELHQYDLQYDREIASRYRPKVEREVSTRYAKANAEDFKAITIGAANREIYINNDVKFIYTKKDDTFTKIAQDFNIYSWQVYSYNDMSKKDQLQEGQMIYLEVKKKKGDKPYHIVQPGESLNDISQLYAVKLKKICKYNTLDKDAILFPNQKIKLQN